MQGNVTELIDITGQIVIRYRHDVETGYYYLQARYYDPEIGRFISIDDANYISDDISSGINLYAYALNNPVMYTDGAGTSPTWNWGTFWKGAFMVATAVGAIAISIGTFGAATPLAMTIIAGVTLGAGVLTGINGVATLVEAGTDYNFVGAGGSLFGYGLEFSKDPTGGDNAVGARSFTISLLPSNGKANPSGFTEYEYYWKVF